MVITVRRKLGDVGENIASMFLTKHGYRILGRNYLRKWGEIDIIASKDNLLHFVEVKSVSRRTSEWVTHGTSAYRPEENVHPQKLKRLFRTIQTYLLEKKLDDTDWQLDVAVVLIDEEKRKGRVELIENVIL